MRRINKAEQSTSNMNIQHVLCQTELQLQGTENRQAAVMRMHLVQMNLTSCSISFPWLKKVKLLRLL